MGFAWHFNFNIPFVSISSELSQLQGPWLIGLMIVHLGTWALAYTFWKGNSVSGLWASLIKHV